MPKPIKPVIDPLALADSGPQQRGQPAVAAINNLNLYLKESEAYRQGSAETLDTGSLDISALGLQPGSIVRQSADGTTLVTPEIAPAFADGGYHFEDKITYSTGEQAAAMFKTSETGFTVGREGDYRFVGSPDGTTADEVLSRHALTMPAYPFNLPGSFRAIVRLGSAAITFEHFDSDGLRAGTSAFIIRPGASNTVEAYCYTPYNDVDRVQDNYRLANILSDIQTAQGADYRNSILVFECTLITNPEILDDNGERVEFLRDTGTITVRFGSYSTIEEAYADTGDGRAFACLDPDHSNYIGELTYFGLYQQDFAGSTGYTIPVISTSRLYYADILTGSLCNDINNFTLADMPEEEEQLNSELDSSSIA